MGTDSKKEERKVCLDINRPSHGGVELSVEKYGVYWNYGAIWPALTIT